VLAQITKTFSPLYFKVVEQKEVMSTEQPCDLAYEFGDGHLDLCNYPRHFPIPGGIYLRIVLVQGIYSFR
jgi:hypothetical protein